MLVYLFEYLQQFERFFSVFHYVTLRAILGALTALIITLVFGPWIIRWLQHYQVGQVVREEGPQSHLKKTGTPTMGGVLILVAMLASTLLWSRLNNLYVWLVLLSTVGFGLLGCLDDYRKLILKNTKGLSARRKLFWQLMISMAVAASLYFMASQPVETGLLLPFFKNIVIPLGWFYFILAFFVIAGTSNAVNLTDGLDGLAIMPSVMVACALGVFAYVTGHLKFAEYLAMPYIPGVQELAVFCGAFAGAGLGFLWFNTYPAQVFMGDVGSLALGAALGVVAVIVRQELVLFIMGGMFVLETVSVILQVGYFKMTGGKRLFRMAPLHHHFELLGWAEPKVIVRFWIITFVLVLFGLATLKLR